MHSEQRFRDNHSESTKKAYLKMQDRSQKANPNFSSHCQNHDVKKPYKKTSSAPVTDGLQIPSKSCDVIPVNTICKLSLRNAIFEAKLVRCTAMSITDEGIVYASFGKRSNIALSAISEMLENKNINPVMDPEMATRGVLCGAPIYDWCDFKYGRAVIVSVDHSKARLLFLDFGYIKECWLSDLQILREKFLLNFRCLCVAVLDATLFGLPKHTIKKFNSLFDNPGAEYSFLEEETNHGLYIPYHAVHVDDIEVPVKFDVKRGKLFVRLNILQPWPPLYSQALKSPSIAHTCHQMFNNDVWPTGKIRDVNVSHYLTYQSFSVEITDTEIQEMYEIMQQEMDAFYEKSSTNDLLLLFDDIREHEYYSIKLPMCDDAKWLATDGAWFRGRLTAKTDNSLKFILIDKIFRFDEHRYILNISRDKFNEMSVYYLAEKFHRLPGKIISCYHRVHREIAQRYSDEVISDTVLAYLIENYGVKVEATRRTEQAIHHDNKHYLEPTCCIEFTVTSSKFGVFHLSDLSGVSELSISPIITKADQGKLCI